MRYHSRLFAAALALLAIISFFPIMAQTVAPGTPAAGGSGAPSTPPSGNYPGSGSSPQPGTTPPALAPSGPTPGSGQGGVTNTPPTGITPGSGASPTTPSAGANASGPPPVPPYTGGH